MKEEEEIYNGQFLIDEKMQDVVQDVLFVLEKWQCRTLEKQIVLDQVKNYIQQSINNKIAQSRTTEANGFMKKMFKKVGIQDE